MRIVLLAMLLTGCMVDGDLPTGTDKCPDVLVYLSTDTTAVVADSILYPPECR